MVHSVADSLGFSRDTVSIERVSTALHIFRRDLRLHDNTALIEALSNHDTVHACFIVDPRQTTESNEYRSLPAMQFMVESLLDLERQLKDVGGTMNYFQGEAESVLREILANSEIDAVYINMDYTPFALKRDKSLAKVCEKAGVSFTQKHDTLLHAPGDILKDDGTPYTVFTPFYKKAMTGQVREPQSLPNKNFAQKNLKGAPQTIKEALEKEENSDAAVRGGRTAARDILKSMKTFQGYMDKRDIPELDATTHLSAYHKFGCVSARETFAVVARTFGPGHDLNRELYWRDFFTCIAAHFPHVYEGAFSKKYNSLQWNTSKKDFAAWCEGRTGFPIVDAGMRELNATGYMHNRVRMITASFLVKDLHINWQWGEKYFASKLIDYDPAVNNGSWQWSASTGCDAQPYFRVFNPWLQQKRYDPECVYIKRWVPELSELEPKHIHKWFKQPDGMVGYPKPMLDHSQESAAAKEMYKHMAKA